MPVRSNSSDTDNHVSKHLLFWTKINIFFSLFLLSEKAEDDTSDGYPRHTEAEEQEHLRAQERQQRRIPGKAPVISAWPPSDL